MITGSGGFIGQYLARNLASHEIESVTRREINLSDGYQLQRHLSCHSYDWIINCAAVGRNRVKDVDPLIFQENCQIHANLLSVKHLVKGIINFGTGAEFDISQHITEAKETDIWNRYPAHSYGLSKNVISRFCCDDDCFYTLRLFGCFDPSEDNARPFKKLDNMIQQNQQFVIEQDRWFDWFGARDMLQVIEHVLERNCQYRDINLVYSKKTRLSDALRLYCELHGADPDMVKIIQDDGLNYTGDGSRLDSLSLSLLGLETSLEHYRIS